MININVAAIDYMQNIYSRVNTIFLLLISQYCCATFIETTVLAFTVIIIIMHLWRTYYSINADAFHNSVEIKTGK